MYIYIYIYIYISRVVALPRVYDLHCEFSSFLKYSKR